MKNNKKGFTLAETLMVVGIIVILSGATVIGVVSWINSAKNTAAKLEQENGDNFENDARKAVESVKGTAPSHVINQTNMNTPAPTAKPTDKPEDTPRPTTKPNDPTPTTKPADPTPTTKPDDPTPTNGNGGGNVNSQVVNSTSNYEHWNDSQGQLPISINQDGIKNANTITLKFTVNSGTITGIDNLGNYNPKITFNGNTATVVIKKNEVPEWLKNNWNNGNFGDITPQFRLANGTDTKVSLTSASYS